MRNKIIIFTVVLIILLSLWFVNPDKKAHKKLDLAKKPDFFIHNFTIQTTNQQGFIVSNMKSPLAEGYIKKKYNFIKQPEVEIKQENGSIWLMQAAVGESFDNNRRILLKDGIDARNNVVDMQQRFATEEIWIYPERNFASTDKHVTLVRPGAESTGVGANFYFDTNTVKFLSNCKTIFSKKL